MPLLPSVHRKQEPPQLRLAFGQVGLNADGSGCNTWGANEWHLIEGVLDVTEMGMTLMSCPPAEGHQDAWFGSLVSSDPLLTLDGDRVVLTKDDTVVTFVDGPWR